MNQPFTICPGRKVDHPVFPFWQPECLNCQRRVASAKPDDVVISPWQGHGPCPDKMELPK